MPGLRGFRTFGIDHRKGPPRPRPAPSVGWVTPGLPDALKVACAAGDTSLHLARRHAQMTGVPQTLCGLVTHTAKPNRPYLSAGCVDCSQAALDVGIEVVRDTGRAFVNLRRVARGSPR